MPLKMIKSDRLIKTVLIGSFDNTSLLKKKLRKAASLNICPSILLGLEQRRCVSQDTVFADHVR